MSKSHLDTSLSCVLCIQDCKNVKNAKPLQSIWWFNVFFNSKSNKDRTFFFLQLIANKKQGQKVVHKNVS